MTATLRSELIDAADGQAADGTVAGGWRRFGSRPWLLLIALAQVALALRPGLSKSPFQDEGLYIYMGHRMLDHLVHGAAVTEHPGSYFSGAPGFYPVLAALGDDAGGLAGARAVSLLFAVLAMVGVYGIALELFGTLAGVFAAAAFAANGSVIFQSHLATYDSMMMAFVAGACWLAVRSARRDGLLWAPVVGLLLALAFFAKYAGAVYAPMVALVAVAVGWRTYGWIIVRRAVFSMLATAAMVYFVLQLFGRDTIRGIRTTTASRAPLAPASVSDLTHALLRWTAPWLVLAILGAVLLIVKNRGALGAALLLGTVIGAAQQIRIHEATSLAKHAAFGIVFAAPLVGYLLSALCRKARWFGAAVAVAVVLSLTASGLHYSKQFLTGWVDDRDLKAPLVAALALNPDKAILGEEPSPERYALRSVTVPTQWNDTFSFSYGDRTGTAAYRMAIDQSHFGVIYLSLTTPAGRWVHFYLTAGGTPYRLRGKAPRYLRGHYVGDWLIYVPKIS